MARINPYNPRQFACGISGLIFLRDVIGNLEGTDKPDKIVVNGGYSAASAKGPNWYDPNRIIAQINAQLHIVDVRSGDHASMLDDGVFDYCCAASRFSALTQHDGIVINGSARPKVHLETPKPVCYGVEGSLAYFPWNGQGFYALSSDGLNTDIVSTERVDDHKIFKYGWYLWREDGVVHYQFFGVKSTIPTIVTGDGQFGWVDGIIIGGKLWIIYHVYSINKVVMHPFDSFNGWVVGNGLCFYNDSTMLTDTDGYVVYAQNPTDNVEFQVVKFFNVNDARVDLRKLVSNPIPTPVPPIPTPEPVMPKLTDAEFATLVAERAKFGQTVTPEQIGIILNNTGWAHRPNVGMQAKNGGTVAIQPVTGKTIWNGIRIIRDGKHYGIDCLGSASIGIATPVNADSGDADPNSFVAPVEVPVTDPNPIPVPPSGDLEGRVSAIESKLSQIGRILS